MHVERELQELREKLAKVEECKKRRDEIDKELAQVWVEGGDGGEALPPPEYTDEEKGKGVEPVDEFEDAQE